MSPSGSTLPSRLRTDRLQVILATLQGAYYTVGGAWPLVHMRSFEAVTGPKSDEWLVRTVAGVLLYTGVLLLHDAFREQRIDRGLRLMAGGVSGVLAVVALVSSIGGWISWVYFLDGLAHGSFAVGWAFLSMRSRTR